MRKVEQREKCAVNLPDNLKFRAVWTYKQHMDLRRIKDLRRITMNW